MIRTILFILAGFPLLGYGQIRITSSDMPSANTSHEYATTNALTINVTRTGANYDWDFTDLQATEYDIARYVSSLQTIYLLQFGFSAIGEKNADTLGLGPLSFTNVHEFYRNDATRYRAVGIGFQFSQVPLPIAGVHDDPDEVYFFPLEYGDRDSSTFDVTTSLGFGPASLGSFRRIGYRITEVDGWGTISTPFVTNEPCIRVKSTVVESDSLRIPNPEFSIGIPRRIITYNWLSNNYKTPVLSVTGTQVAGFFVPTQARFRVDWSAIEIDFTATTQHPKQGDTLQLIAQVDGKQLNYQWSINPDTGFSLLGASTLNSINPEIVFNDTGWYDVQLVVSNSVNRESEVKQRFIHVHKNTGQPWCEILSVYPNPAKETLQYHLGYHYPGNVQLIDMKGSIVWEGPAMETGEIDVTHLSTGIYGLILDKCPKSFNTKVVVE